MKNRTAVFGKKPKGIKIEILLSLAALLHGRGVRICGNEYFRHEMSGFNSEVVVEPISLNYPNITPTIFVGHDDRILPNPHCTRIHPSVLVGSNSPLNVGGVFVDAICLEGGDGEVLGHKRALLDTVDRYYGLRVLGDPSIASQNLLNEVYVYARIFINSPKVRNALVC